MQNRAAAIGLLACSAVIGWTLALARGTPAAARIAEQDALFSEQYESDLQARPELATSYGDYRFNDRLNDYSAAGAEAQHERDVRFLQRLKGISTAGFPEHEVMSHQVMRSLLEQRIANHEFKEFEMPVNQMDGPQVRLADLPLAVPLDSLQHYEDYLARLRQIPRALSQTQALLRAGMHDGLMPVRFLLEKVPGQCLGIIAADPFLLPTKKYPDSIAPADRQRLSREITASVVQQVLPAYLAFATFIEQDYAPAGRTTLAATSLPGGVPRYLNDIRSRTTLANLSPDEIHRIGLAEIARIEGEMLAIAHREGFEDLAAFREFVHTSPKYRPTSAEQILDDFREYIAQMQPKLPELFGLIPAAPVTVEAMPDFQPGNATHYQTGTPDGKRPGRVVVATANFAQRSLVNDEAVAYHEGIPGHHMQLSVAQTLTDLPEFRRHGGNSGYIEGWALYAEQLGKEVGFYQDPVSDYGRLSSELFRAVRLVVDTGLHSKGWTRDQVVALLRQTQAVDEPTLQSETDRYIAWPAQALAYKLGQLKIRELRQRAQRTLGTGFDLRAFHDEILNGGVLPLDLLDARINHWIQGRRSSAHRVR